MSPGFLGCDLGVLSTNENAAGSDLLVDFFENGFKLGILKPSPAHVPDTAKMDAKQATNVETLRECLNLLLTQQIDGQLKLESRS